MDEYEAQARRRVMAHTRPPAPPKYGIRFLKIFGWLMAFNAAIAFVAFALSYVGDPPEWNRFDRLMDAVNNAIMAGLCLTVARYEERDA